MSPGSIDAGGSDGSSLRPGGGRRGNHKGIARAGCLRAGPTGCFRTPPPHNLSLPASSLKPPPTGHYTSLSLTRCLPPIPTSYGLHNAPCSRRFCSISRILPVLAGRPRAPWCGGTREPCWGLQGSISEEKVEHWLGLGSIIF